MGAMYLREGMWRSSPHTWAWWEPAWPLQRLQTSVSAAGPPASCLFAGRASPSAQQSDRSRGQCGSRGRESSLLWPSLDGSGWSPKDRRNHQNREQQHISIRFISNWTNLSLKAVDVRWRILLGVAGHVPSPQVLDGHILNVEPNVVSWQSCLQPLVVHLNGLHLSSELGRGEHQSHAGFEDASFNLTNWHGPNSWTDEQKAFLKS